MGEQRINGRTVSRMTGHMVRRAECGHSVSVGDIQNRCREALIRACDVEGTVTLKCAVGRDHAHVHTEHRPSRNVGTLEKKLRGRSPRKLQLGFPGLGKRRWGRHFWAIGFGCRSTGNMADKMADEYLEHHRKSGNGTDSLIIGQPRTADFGQIQKPMGLKSIVV